ncbi:hypothetical protein IFT83_08735 [Massilia sp. CFBP 13647]|nr:hypothetical protein [Massilia sp. CFBP 13647]MBD8674106.1 hypothetical protein [Massilia sp. CFBP 13721]
MRHQILTSALAAALCAGTSLAWAALPAPTPAQAQAAAAKKAASDAQAAKDKQALTASMDALSTRWRSNAASKGWTTHPPVAIAAAPAPGAAGPVAGSPAVGAAAAGVPAPGPSATGSQIATSPAGGAVPQAVQTTGVAITGTPMPGVAPRATGVSANTLTGTPAGQAAASPGNGAAPRSAQALQSANVPIKSEKHGTAAPSADVKKVPTQSVPKGASPAVDKGNAKEMKNQ